MNTTSEQEIVKLKKQLEYYEKLRQQVKEYLAANEMHQQYESQHKDNLLQQNFSLAQEVRSSYKFVGWMSPFKKLNTGKAKTRAGQIDLIENIAIQLQNEQAENVTTEEFQGALLTICNNLNLRVPRRDGVIDNNEDNNLLRVTKGLVLLGMHLDVKHKINKETNFFPSKLLKMIEQLKKKIKYDLGALSNGLIKENQVEMMARQAFEEYKELVLFKSMWSPAKNRV